MNQTDLMNTFVTSSYIIIGFLVESGSIKYKYNTHTFRNLKGMFLMEQVSIKKRIVGPFVCFGTLPS